MPRILCLAALLVSSLLVKQSLAQEYLATDFGTELAAKLAAQTAKPVTEDTPRHVPPTAATSSLTRPAVHETPDRYVGAVRQASHNEVIEASSTTDNRATSQKLENATDSTGDQQTGRPTDSNTRFPAWNPHASSQSSDSGIAPSTEGLGSVVTVVSSLAVVLGLFFITAWLMRRTGPAVLAALPADVFETLGRAQLNNRQQVHLVRCGAKLLLVSVTPDSAETLTEIDDPDEVTRLAGLCKANQAGSASAAFRQVLHQFAGQPAEPGFVGRTNPQTSRAPLSSELENFHG